MTITFADGTQMEVPATAFEDFVKHDLKWVEFVHGRAAGKQLPELLHPSVDPVKQSVHRCPTRTC